MKFSPERLTAFARWCLSFLGAIVPVFFLPVSLDLFEIHKQTLMIVGVCLAFLFWLLAQAARGTFVLRGGVRVLMPFLLPVFLAVAAGFSQSPYASWVGANGGEMWSVLSVFAYVLAYFVAVQVYVEAKHVRQFFLSVFVSGILCFVILALFKMFPVLANSFGSSVLASPVFNPFGTTRVFLGHMVFLLLAGVGAFAFHRPQTSGWALFSTEAFGLVQKISVALLLVCSFGVLILTDSADVISFVWTTLIVAMLGLMVVFFWKPDVFSSVYSLSPSLFLFAFSLLFGFLLSNPLPWSVPVDQLPSAGTSWTVAKSTLSNVPVFGSGAGTYMLDYATYRPVEINKDVLWNVRFGSGSSWFLTLLPTHGVLGTFVWVLVLLALVLPALRLTNMALSEKWSMSAYAYFLAGSLVLLSFFAPMSVSLLFLLFMCFGLGATPFAVAVNVTPRSEQKRARFLGGFGAIMCVLVLSIVGFLTTQRYAADIAYASALRADQQKQSLSDLIMLLDRAATLNRFDDTYYRTLAQALVLRVQEEMKSTTSPETTSASRSEYILSLMGAATQAAVKATDLSPNNALNWQQRGRVYKAFLDAVSDASTFMISSFTKVTELEPNNPEAYTELAQAYFLQAESKRPLTAAEDKTLKESATKEVTELLAKAEVQLKKALELKPTFAQAQFQLALTYERMGKLQEAIDQMEAVSLTNPKDVGVAFQLGQLYLRRGETGDRTHAELAFKHAIELFPGYVMAHWFLASIYEQDKNISAAISELEKTLEMNTDEQFKPTIQSRLDRLKGEKK